MPLIKTIKFIPVFLFQTADPYFCITSSIKYLKEKITEKNRDLVANDCMLKIKKIIC